MAGRGREPPTGDLRLVHPDSGVAELHPRSHRERDGGQGNPVLRRGSPPPARPLLAAARSQSVGTWSWTGEGHGATSSRIGAGQTARFTSWEPNTTTQSGQGGRPDPFEAGASGGRATRRSVPHGTPSWRQASDGSPCSSDKFTSRRVEGERPMPATRTPAVTRPPHLATQRGL